MSDKILVSKSDLALICRGWDKDYQTPEAQEAMRRIRGAGDAVCEACVAVVGTSSATDNPECLECTAPAVGGLYCAEHAVGVKR